MRKVLLVALNDLRRTLTDRTLVLLMFAAPLALATIIALTFGDLASGDAPVSEVPIVVVNEDAGSDTADFAAILTEILTAGRVVEASAIAEHGAADACASLFAAADGSRPEGGLATTDAPPSAAVTGLDLSGLIVGARITRRAAAEECVARGVATAAVIIRDGFSESLANTGVGADAGGEREGAGDTAAATTHITVLGNPNRPIAVGIVENVVAALSDGFAATSIAASAVVSAAEGPRSVLVLNSDTFQERLASLQAGRGLPRIETDRSVAGSSGPSFNPLVFFGSTQAIFFALFAANGGATGILEEHRDGTLERMLVSPTRRITILLGKAIGVFVMIFVQLLFLFLAFTLVATVFAGAFVFIWGNNMLGIALALVAASVAAAGLGMIVASAAKTPGQGSTVGSVLALLMATLGGAFGFTVGPPISYISIVYWGSNAFAKLAAGVGGYGLNVLVLGTFGIATFFAGLAVFERRFAT